MREGTPHTHLRPPECSSLLEEGTYTRAASVGMEMNEMNGERARRHMESVRSCEGLGEGTRVNQQMRTGMNAVSQIGDRRGTLERCREGKGEAHVILL